MSMLKRVDRTLIGTWEGNIKEAVEQSVKELVSLSGANLFEANLSGASLSGANLFEADLSYSDLSVANLSKVNLSYSDLSVANLYGADLSGANLYGANLYKADLSYSDLYGANLSGANLYGANLSGANLSEANLSGANLSRTSAVRTKGYKIISVGAEKRGYDFYLVLNEQTNSFLIRAGCHTWKSFSEARDHYCNNYTSTGDIKECLARINFLETLLKIYRWEES